MVASQFEDFMILVLISAAVISGIIGEAADAAIVPRNRAERLMAALRQLAALKAVAGRKGDRMTSTTIGWLLIAACDQWAHPRRGKHLDFDGLLFN
jgi:Ca2+-transporting ATPase